MLTVACVLKLGGDFRLDYPARLAGAVRKHLSLPHRFVCLTDHPDEVDVETITLTRNYPGQWSKMEVFALPGPVLYLDLDTLILGAIDPLAEGVCGLDEQEFLALQPVGTSSRNSKGHASGIMGWTGDKTALLNRFANELGSNHSGFARFQDYGHQLNLHGRVYIGDQNYIKAAVPRIGWRWTIAQKYQLGIYGYHRDVKVDGLQPDATIVCLHGPPRQHQIYPIPKWVEENWWEVGYSCRVN